MIDELSYNKHNSEVVKLRRKLLTIMLFELGLPRDTRDWLWNFYHGDTEKDPLDVQLLGRVLNTVVAKVPTAARWCS